MGRFGAGWKPAPTIPCALLMLVNGSDLTEREMPLVLDYLSTAFPAGPAAAPEED